MIMLPLHPSYVFIILSLLLSACYGAVTWPSSVIPSQIGVNIHFTSPLHGEMDMLADAGFRFVRMDFHWDDIERSKGVYDFAAYDTLVSNLDAKNMKAIFILDYSNPLYDNNLSPHTDVGREAFARWAVAGVSHFKGKGYLWEMYNEPNINFWKPAPNVTDYSLLALTVGKAIKAAFPDEIYIGPTTSQFDWNFMESVFKAGALEYFDAVSLHPYRQTWPETVIPDYAQLRQLISKYAPANKKDMPIIASEWGYSTLYSQMNITNQGKVLPRQLLTNVAQGIKAMIWYDWHDDGTNASNIEHHFGTVYYTYYQNRIPCYDPKPAYLSAKTLLTSLAGYQFSHRIDVGSSTDYVYVFSSSRTPQQLAYAAYTSVPGQQITIQVGVTSAPSSCFVATSYLGGVQPQKRCVDDNRKLQVTLEDAPLYLTPS